MPRRVILTARQRATLFDLPTDEATILRHYIFSDTDLALVKRRQWAANQIGFGLQLCAFRYPGRLIQPGEVIPKTMLDFVAGQLGVSADEADRYAVTGTTRYRHSADLQRLLGYRPCSGRARDDLIDWLIEIAGSAKANVDLALKSALCLHRKGEIRDRTSDRQAVRAAGLNFLTAAVIYHNTATLGQVVTELPDEGRLPDSSLLTHASPLGWEHINLTGEYQWSRQPNQTC